MDEKQLVDGATALAEKQSRVIKIEPAEQPQNTPASMRSQSGWSAVSAGPCIAAAHGRETVKNESCGAV